MLLFSFGLTKTVHLICIHWKCPLREISLYYFLQFAAVASSFLTLFGNFSYARCSAFSLGKILLPHQKSTSKTTNKRFTTWFNIFIFLKAETRRQWDTLCKIIKSALTLTLRHLFTHFLSPRQ